MRLESVTVKYRERARMKASGVTALSDVSLSVRPGEKVGVIGANGAGKSTLLRVMAGIMRPDAGSSDNEGMSASLLSLHAGFDSELSGTRNIVMHGMLMGLSRRQAALRISRVAGTAGLGDAIHRRVSTYSSGMRARLCFWTAMYIQPDLMLIDEVLSVGDQQFREQSRIAIQEVMSSERAVVVASHNLAFIGRLCDRVIWIDQGRVRSDGPGESVIETYKRTLATSRKLQNKTSPNEPLQRRHLFVCGAARSGTTALARLLNTHPDIVVGIERFKYRLLGTQPETDYDSLFSRERFFSHVPGDTNIDINTSYVNDVEKMRAKFDSAVYVGDKIPGLYKRLKFVSEAFPHCKVVFIVRDPMLVAASWESRANDASDGWSEHQGYVQAVEEWNRSLAYALKARHLMGRDFISVSYERTFVSRGHAVLRELTRQLELERHWDKQTDRFLSAARGRARGTRVVSDAIREYVERHADYGRYVKLMASCL